MSESQQKNTSKGAPIYLLKPEKDFRKAANKIIAETIKNPQKNPLYVIGPAQINLKEEKEIKENIINKYKAAIDKTKSSINNHVNDQKKQKQEDYDKKGIFLTEMQGGQKAADLLMNSLAVIEDSNVRVFNYEIFKKDYKKGKKEFDKKFNRSKPKIDPKDLFNLQIQRAKQVLASTGNGIKNATENQSKMYHPDAATGNVYQGGGRSNIKLENVGKVLEPIAKTVGHVGDSLDLMEAAVYFKNDKPAEGTAKVAGIAGSKVGSAATVAIAGKVCPKMVKGANKPIVLGVAGLSCFGVLWYAGDKAGGDVAEGLIIDMVGMTPEEKKEYNKKLEEQYGVGTYEHNTLSSD
ncbi:MULTISPECIES: hypothetical protein [Acinetobacter]|jgi:hypothetical protein|uniref:hypothetical protein n=1 Tax=Acinetobacter TaxID=469 RepID=UPI001250C3EB|nr:MULTISPECIES: hypothetical protein [Acinetobacter]MBJ9903935.1 hypothetical protein [Acinetobacter bereziniae]MCU4319973.1 hypothetical protein [Acinetobacter bereziniae]MCU4418304.1 hypothetical protein [Acinetobacter bereziniae]MCU4600707.1 hypothetical protein [Acinetobacter bereziniae]MDR3030508.1 hypothetical protein [Acinetobacter sp.]